jgi:ATP/maltotriose-dependent transcriptional regulator MalT
MDDAKWAGRFLYTLGNCLWYQGKYAQARQLGEEAFPLARQWGNMRLQSLIISRLLGPAAYQMGDYAEAKRCFEQGLQIAGEIDPNETWHTAVAHKGLGDVALAREDFAQARWRYQQQTRIMVEVGYKQGDVLLSLLSVGKLLRAEGEKEAAVEILTLIVEHPATIPLLQKQAKEERSPLEAELVPEVYAAAIERGSARDLDATANEIIVGFSRKVESAPAAPSSLFSQSLMDSLTEREQEILRLIADGLSNAEIAQALYIALATVKVHSRNIFSKLNVSSRTQAIAQAQKLKLL